MTVKSEKRGGKMFFYVLQYCTSFQYQKKGERKSMRKMNPIDVESEVCKSVLFINVRRKKKKK